MNTFHTDTADIWHDLQYSVLHQSMLSFCHSHMQVFLAEQVLYSKQELNSHKQNGDKEGPLAESGFTGHCYCK